MFTNAAAVSSDTRCRRRRAQADNTLPSIRNMSSRERTRTTYGNAVVALVRALPRLRLLQLRYVPMLERHVTELRSVNAECVLVLPECGLTPAVMQATGVRLQPPDSPQQM